MGSGSVDGNSAEEAGKANAARAPPSAARLASTGTGTELTRDATSAVRVAWTMAAPAQEASSTRLRGSRSAVTPADQQEHHRGGGLRAGDDPQIRR